MTLPTLPLTSTDALNGDRIIPGIHDALARRFTVVTGEYRPTLAQRLEDFPSGIKFAITRSAGESGFIQNNSLNNPTWYIPIEALQEGLESIVTRFWRVTPAFGSAGEPELFGETWTGDKWGISDWREAAQIDPEGFTRKFFRTIEDTSEPGTPGWVARRCFRNPDGTIRRLYAEVYRYGSGGWVLSGDPTQRPDILSDHGLAQPGDIIGPWLFEEMIRGIDLLRISTDVFDLVVVEEDGIAERKFASFRDVPNWDAGAPGPGSDFAADYGFKKPLTEQAFDDYSTTVLISNHPIGSGFAWPPTGLDYSNGYTGARNSEFHAQFQISTPYDDPFTQRRLVWTHLDQLFSTRTQTRFVERVLVHGQTHVIDEGDKDTISPSIPTLAEYEEEPNPFIAGGASRSTLFGAYAYFSD